MKKALRETQALRAGCSKAEPKIFAPPQTPFPEAREGQNLISWRWSLRYLYVQIQFGEDRCTQFRVIVVTDPRTHKHTKTNPQTGPITIHCAVASAQCKDRRVMPTYTRSSADADNGLDAFSGQSRSTNMVPFHMLSPVYSAATQLNSTRRLVVQRVGRRVGIGRLVLSVVSHSRAI